MAESEERFLAFLSQGIIVKTEEDVDCCPTCDGRGAVGHKEKIVDGKPEPDFNRSIACSTCEGFGYVRYVNYTREDGKKHREPSRWGSANEQTALRAVEILPDSVPEELVAAASRAQFDSVRAMAMQRIRGQALDKVVAMNGELPLAIRKAAVGFLSDADILAYLAERDANEFVREYAVRNTYLTDAAVLERVAVYDTHFRVREAAVGKVTNRSCLMELAEKDPNDRVRRLAESKLTSVRED